MTDNNRIDDKELENISGGLIFNATNIAGSDPANPWEVIDNKNGNVIGRFPTRDQAYASASSYHGSTYDTIEINWNDLCNLRSNPVG